MLPSVGRTSLAVIALVMLLAVSHDAANAQTKTVRDWHVSVSPFHLLVPALEINMERSVSERSGFAGILALGSVHNLFLFELGAQYHYYLIGDFDHGMQVGGELLWASASDNDDEISTMASGLSLGPYLGYKVAANFGLSFNIQAGPAIMMIRASASDGESSASATGSAFYPLLNLNLGWSF